MTLRIEFKGAVVLVDGLTGGFTLTVGGETVTFSPTVAQPQAMASKVDNYQNGDYFYRLRFSRDIPWSMIGQKINVIKCVRAHTGMGLGEAKMLVEGSETMNYIKGPPWHTSEFLRDLLTFIRPEHITAEPCPWHQTVSPMHYR